MANDQHSTAGRSSGANVEDSLASSRLLVFLGAAPGVGKTVAMLNEGRRREGADVIVAGAAFFNAKNKKGMIQKLRGEFGSAR